MRRKKVVVVAALVVLVGLSGCSGSGGEDQGHGDGSTAAPRSTTRTIDPIDMNNGGSVKFDDQGYTATVVMKASDWVRGTDDDLVAAGLVAVGETNLPTDGTDESFTSGYDPEAAAMVFGTFTITNTTERFSLDTTPAVASADPAGSICVKRSGAWGCGWIGGMAIGDHGGTISLAPGDSLEFPFIYLAPKAFSPSDPSGSSLSGVKLFVHDNRTLDPNEWDAFTFPVSW